jgi:23S rRNA (cytidine2498-2'-O)-methyltransferase
MTAPPADAPRLPVRGEWLWTCREGAEVDLQEELERAGLGPRLLGPAVVVSAAQASGEGRRAGRPGGAPRDLSGPPLEPVFARQAVPVLGTVTAAAGAASEDELATRAAALLQAYLAALPPPALANPSPETATTPSTRGAAPGALSTACALQGFVPDAEATNPLAGELARLEAQVGARLEGARLVTPARARDLGRPLFQLVLLAPGQLVVGAGLATAALSLHPGGRRRLREDPRAPSRAAMKLDEALEWLGRGPDAGDLCVDLGAAPGGWTHVLLQRRARVIAVDPARMAPSLQQLLTRPPKGRRGAPPTSGPLRHMQLSAFDYQPEESPVDWLLCDMAWRPLEVAQLLAKWARRGWARFLVANIKLPMKRKVEMLDQVLATLQGGGWKDLRARQLYHDRDEITLGAWR